jgi:hypothetical protein
MLKISAAKVACAIACAREHDAVAGSWNSQIQQEFQDDTVDDILYAFATTSGSGTLAEFVASLNTDERTSLLAIAWIGRGVFAPENLAEAIEKAKTASPSPNGSDLTSIPLLAEYLREGMEKLETTLADRDDRPTLQ